VRIGLAGARLRTSRTETAERRTPMELAPPASGATHWKHDLGKNGEG
jgi:hypothetical protein